MPLFAYVCKKCGESSEILVRSEEKPACPGCGSKQLEKQMSQFAPVSGASRGPACESCCPSAGSCSLQGGGCGLT
jgi:putative FmdB family regulatory protein